jgi:hypothetical protein
MRRCHWYIRSRTGATTSVATAGCAASPPAPPRSLAGAGGHDHHAPATAGEEGPQRGLRSVRSSGSPARRQPTFAGVPNLVGDARPAEQPAGPAGTGRPRTRQAPTRASHSQAASALAERVGARAREQSVPRSKRREASGTVIGRKDTARGGRRPGPGSRAERGDAPSPATTAPSTAASPAASRSSSPRRERHPLGAAAPEPAAKPDKGAAKAQPPAKTAPVAGQGATQAGRPPC